MGRRRAWWIGTMALLAALAVPVQQAQAAQDAPGAGPAVARPASPARMPSRIEQLSPYLRQVSCDPVAKPGATALGRLLVATYPGTSFGVVRECGATDVPSEHYEGRAVDWTTSVRDPVGAARARAVIRWLLDPDAAGHQYANARRLGVMYLIWNDHIWGSYATDAGWRPYSTCADHPDPGWDTRCHRDHVHISLSWAGAMGRTSFWHRSVADVDHGPCRPADLNWAPPYRRANPLPCPDHQLVTAPDGAPAIAGELARYSGATVGRGSIGPVVTTVQRALGVQPTGYFGPLTAAAVSAFRTAHGLPAGSRLDGATWRALLAAAEA
jgi:peptidoglycan hydrolase-like protein with peptidoglycan-binding domain